MDVKFHITLQQPPAGVDFGLQKGSGNTYETLQTQQSGGQDIRFQLTLPLKPDPEKVKEPQFSGPFVQGKPLGQFFYIDVGTYAGQADGWSRRIKVPLSGISWQTIAELAAHPEAVLTTTIPGTGKDGGPNCATVKPFDGWQVSIVSVE